jgi:uncharacterized protein YbaR (Trm112 family)
VSSSRPAKSGTISTTVGFLVRTVITEQDLHPLRCPDCKHRLNLIQPDENEPSRLLGTCDGCSKWFFLVELEPDWKKTILVELPDGDAMVRKIAAARAPTSTEPGFGPSRSGV